MKREEVDRRVKEMEEPYSKKFSVEASAICSGLLRKKVGKLFVYFQLFHCLFAFRLGRGWGARRAATAPRRSCATRGSTTSTGGGSRPVSE